MAGTGKRKLEQPKILEKNALGDRIYPASVNESPKQSNLPPVFWMGIIPTFSGPFVFKAAGFEILPMNPAVGLVMLGYLVGVTTILKVIYDRLFSRPKKNDRPIAED